MLKSLLSNQRGFTLLEAVMTVFVTAVLLSAISFLFLTTLRNARANEYRLEAQQTARIALDAIVRDVQYAKTIQLRSETDLLIETDKYKDKDKTYYLQPTVRYFLDGTILRREKNDGSGAQPLTGGTIMPVSISKLSFSSLKNDAAGITTVLVTIAVTAADTTINPATYYHYTLQTAVTKLND